MANYEVPEGYRIALIATMPRSGTWYSFYFFEFLDLFLSGRDKLNTRLDLHVYHALRLGKLHAHCICPGFSEVCTGPKRRAWERLTFYTPGFDYGTARFIETNEAVFSPLRNPAIRIIYLYRNPLDQIVSYYRHIEKHRQETTRSFVGESGEETAFQDLGHFLRAVGIDGYVKQYWTYHFMKERAPDQLLLVPYEELVSAPAETYNRMITFLGLGVESAALDEAFAKSLNATTPQSLRNLERSLGTSLGRDQAEEGESHLRGGEVGKWRDLLSSEDRAFVEQRLEAFALDLASFRTEPGL